MNVRVDGIVWESTWEGEKRDEPFFTTGEREPIDSGDCVYVEGRERHRELIKI